VFYFRATAPNKAFFIIKAYLCGMNVPSYFSTVNDFRVIGRCLYSLSDMLGLILCGVLADCSDYPEIVDYGKDKLSFLRSDLGFVFANDIPSADTLERLMRHVKMESLAHCFKQCLQGLSLSGKLVNIDGKSLRGTIPAGKKQAQVQMVNAWCDEYQVSFGQFQIAEKSNEITAIPALLDNMDCAGSIITIDAIGCQKAITLKITEKEADYVISLKGNQGTLLTVVSAHMQKQKPLLTPAKSHDKGHNRGEIRHVYVAPCPDHIIEAEKFSSLRSLIMIERTRIIRGIVSLEVQYYISSIGDLTAKKAMQYVRGHWGIENGLHWQLDFTFREDDSKVRKGNAPANLHLIRKWSLFLLKKVEPEISLKRKRKRANRDDQFLIKILKTANLVR
jgi:predicted transposase YbfD/YdcC